MQDISCGLILYVIDRITYLLVLLGLERHRAGIDNRCVCQACRLKGGQGPLMLKRMCRCYHQKFIVLPHFNLGLLCLGYYLLLAPYHVSLLELLKVLVPHHQLGLFRLTTCNHRLLKLERGDVVYLSGQRFKITTLVDIWTH